MVRPGPEPAAASKPPSATPRRTWWRACCWRLAAAVVCLFLFFDLKGNVGYILPRRAIKVAAMLLVAVAVGVSTLLFQTVTANRILTPSIMGFDSLYILIQTALTFTLGAATVVAAPPTCSSASRCC